MQGLVLCEIIKMTSEQKKKGGRDLKVLTIILMTSCPWPGFKNVT